MGSDRKSDPKRTISNSVHSRAKALRCNELLTGSPHVNISSVVKVFSTTPFTHLTAMERD